MLPQATPELAASVPHSKAFAFTQFAHSAVLPLHIMIKAHA